MLGIAKISAVDDSKRRHSLARSLARVIATCSTRPIYRRHVVLRCRHKQEHHHRRGARAAIVLRQFDRLRAALLSRARAQFAPLLHELQAAPCDESHKIAHSPAHNRQHSRHFRLFEREYRLFVGADHDFRKPSDRRSLARLAAKRRLLQPR